MASTSCGNQVGFFSREDIHQLMTENVFFKEKTDKNELPPSVSSRFRRMVRKVVMKRERRERERSLFMALKCVPCLLVFFCVYGCICDRVCGWIFWCIWACLFMCGCEHLEGRVGGLFCG